MLYKWQKLGLGVTAEGTQVVYTADPQGYGQVFVVDVPDFESLPDRDSLD
jgi:hypothetical protein